MYNLGHPHIPSSSKYNFIWMPVNIYKVNLGSLICPYDTLQRKLIIHSLFDKPQYMTDKSWTNKNPGKTSRQQSMKVAEQNANYKKLNKNVTTSIVSLPAYVVPSNAF